MSRVVSPMPEIGVPGHSPWTSEVTLATSLRAAADALRVAAEAALTYIYIDAPPRDHLATHSFLRR